MAESRWQDLLQSYYKLLVNQYDSFDLLQGMPFLRAHLSITTYALHLQHIGSDRTNASRNFALRKAGTMSSQSQGRALNKRGILSSGTIVLGRSSCVSIWDIFPDVQAILTDVDGTLTKGIEALHPVFWLEVMLEAADIGLREQGLNGEQIQNGLTLIRGKLHKHLTHVFETGQFKNLISGCHLILQDGWTENKHQYSALPKDLQSLDQLKNWSRPRRHPAMLRAFRDGRWTVMDGVFRMFPAFRSNKRRKLRVGIYTNSDQLTAETLLHEALGEHFLNEHVKFEGHKLRRLFGDDPEIAGRVKPDPYGWLVLAKRMAVEPKHSIIFEDRPLVLSRALLEAGFMGGVLVAPDDKSHRAAREYFAGWKGPGVVIVKNMHSIAGT